MNTTTKTMTNFSMKMRINEDFIDNISTEEISTNTVETGKIEYKYRVLLVNPFVIEYFDNNVEKNMTWFLEACRSADKIMNKFPFIDSYRVEIIFNTRDKDQFIDYPILDGKYEVRHVPSYSCRLDHYYVAVYFNYSQAPSYMQLLGMFTQLMMTRASHPKTKTFKAMTKIKRGFENTNMASWDKTYIEYMHRKGEIAMNMWDSDLKNFIQEYYPRDTFVAFTKQLGRYVDFQKESIKLFIPERNDFDKSLKISENYDMSVLSNKEKEALYEGTLYAFDAGIRSGCYFLDWNFTQDKKFPQLTEDEFSDMMKEFIFEKAKTINAYSFKANGYKIVILFFNEPFIGPDKLNNVEFSVFSRIVCRAP